ncbi:TPA: hypothetical protein ACH3X1_005325 [Trebouxia sp. C0004]
MLTLIICVALAATAVSPHFTACALRMDSPDPLDATASPSSDLPDLREVLDLGKPDAWLDMHVGTVSSNSPKVLLVLDPNGLHCWEDVHIDSFVNETLLAWLHDQSDALTVGKLPGTSLPLQLPIGLQGPRTAQTFAEMVEQAWQTQATTIKVPSQLLVAFQMTLLCMGQGSSQNSAGTSCLDRTQLKVTHVDNFWKAVERTVAAGHLSPAASELPDTLDSGHSNAGMQLSNTVIILPRIVTRLHPVHEAPHDHAYQDLAAWDVGFVIQMLREFLRVSSAQTVPSLEEYRILPDKVMLQNMYESYYRAEPAQRTPPIPTTQVKTQQSAERERELCYLAAATVNEKTAVKQHLLKALLELEHLVAPEHPVRSMVEGGSSAWMGQYIIKREFSEGSRHVFGISLPNLSSARPAAHADPGQHVSGDLDGEAHVCLSDVADGRSQESSGGQAGASILASIKAAVSRVARFLGMSAAQGQKLPSSQQHAVANLALEVQSPDISPDAPICQSPNAAAETQSSSDVHASNVSGGARGSVGMNLTPELDSMLDETADRLLQTSCGEGWLVQPRIANMSGLEYRVYMLGGASAVILSSILSIPKRVGHSIHFPLSPC